MSLQPNFEVLWIEQVLKKPSKTNASKHSIHFPPFQGHIKSIRNSLFSNSLSKMLHFFSMKFATTLDFTGFPVISHLFTDGLTLECPFVRYSVKLQWDISLPFFLQFSYTKFIPCSYLYVLHSSFRRSAILGISVSAGCDILPTLTSLQL